MTESVLSGKYKHFCHEWDGLEIDETCVEFACCQCYENNPEIKLIQEKLYEEMHQSLQGQYTCQN